MSLEWQQEKETFFCQAVCDSKVTVLSQKSHGNVSEKFYDMSNQKLQANCRNVLLNNEFI